MLPRYQHDAFFACMNPQMDELVIAKLSPVCLKEKDWLHHHPGCQVSEELLAHNDCMSVCKTDNAC